MNNSGRGAFIEISETGEIQGIRIFADTDKQTEIVRQALERLSEKSAEDHPASSLRKWLQNFIHPTSKRA